MDTFPLPIAGLLLLVAFLPARMAGASASEAVPAFSLPRHGGEGRVDLASLRGKIIVLDFFAYWCVPCLRASTELESEIGQYYQKRHGNAHGIEVRALAVNVEASHPELTAAFIRKTGLQEVVDDLGGKVYEACGGTAMPFIVIIDFSGPSPRIVYRKAGFEGAAKLRRMIDAIPFAAAPVLGDALAAPFGEGTIYNAGLDFSSLSTTGILLANEHLDYRQSSAASETDLSLSHGSIGVRYIPEFPLEKSDNVSADNFGLQASERARLNDRLALLLGAGTYSGYMDYRSLWFDEHFRQLFAGRAGYQKAHPWGASASAGARWEYLPSAGFVQGEILAQHDVISPGYDVNVAILPPVLERFPDNFNTLSGRATFENVLTPRLRALQEVQVTDTTDRQLRFSLQSSYNWAVTERWVARFVLAGTRESPRFEAASLSAYVGRDWNDTWFVGAIARGYWDNGEIENALLIANTADPALKTFLTGLELRWQGRQSFLRLFAGPYFTDYEQSGTALTTFPHLYENRTWLSAQLVYAHQF